MTLPELSIRKPVFAWMLMLFLILFGWISFNRMGISQLPDVDFPVLNIAITYEAASPEILETDVVDILEDAVMGIQGVRSVSSSVRFGTANITIEFDLGTNLDTALQELQARVAQSQRLLPEDMDPPVISKSNPEDQPILWFSVSSPTLSKPELMRLVRDRLKDRFTTIPGVGEVFLGGYAPPNLRVWVSGKKLERYELAVTDVLDAIANEHTELPAGQIETARREFDVRTMGEVKTPEEFASIVINQRGGQPNFRPFSLGQVARIEEGLADIRRISRFKSVSAVGLGIRKQRGSNAVAVARAAKVRMEEVVKELPEGVSMNLTFDNTQFIEEAVGELNHTLILAALFTSIVCWVFLGSITSTFNVFLAIPTSIMGTFIVLYFAGFTLNTFTLLGLTLAVGIVVDDAIMVLENIVRYAEQKKGKREAALLGANEISFAALAATVSIGAIFLPVAFMRGVIGRYFFEFGVTMTVAVGLSLLEALTLMPMRCSQFLSIGERTSRFGKAFEDSIHGAAHLYRHILGPLLRWRWIVVLTSLALFAVSLLAIQKIPKEFSPAQDQGRFLVRMQTPIDSSLQFTDDKSREAEAVFAAHPAIERYYLAVGGFGGGDVITAMFFVTLREKKDRPPFPKTGKPMTQQQVMAEIRTQLSKITDVKVFLQDLSMRGFSASRGFPIEFSIRGPDWDKLGEISETFQKKLEDSNTMEDIDSDFRLGKPEIQVIPNRQKAAERGVSVRSIARTVNAMIGGVVAGKYEVAGHRNDIRVRLEAEERTQAEAIKHLYVRNNRGELLPLSELVTVKERRALQQIIRADRERAVTIFGNAKDGVAENTVYEKIEQLSNEVLPEGYRMVITGSSQTMKESFQDLFFALILGIVVAYMVLASQFNSFIHPITVLVALPFSITGAFLALLFMGHSLNIYSFIGLILLMGIVKKNSILLVEFTNQIRARGQKDVTKALLEACPIRLRPILMTSVSTIAGALPAALALGPGAETRIPMAIAVIGGVLVSTFLTLLVVPCVYSLFSGLERAPLES